MRALSSSPSPPPPPPSLPVVVGCESTHGAPNDPANCAAAASWPSRLVSPLLHSDQQGAIDRSIEWNDRDGIAQPFTALGGISMDRYLRCAARTVERMRAHSGMFASRADLSRRTDTLSSPRTVLAPSTCSTCSRGVIPSFGREEEAFSPRFSSPFLRRLDRELLIMRE